MKLLLDTHVVLWWLRDDPKLGSKARHMIASGNILVSIATPWEVAIKHRLGKIGESGPAVLSAVEDAGMTIIGIDGRHLAAVQTLPKIHNDPFDHLLIAQAQVEDARIMTDDGLILRYGVPCIGVS
jgi:PIN domain nuclease of toxin-antitoxin system